MDENGAELVDSCSNCFIRIIPKCSLYRYCQLSNNANTCGSNLVLKVPITTNKSGKLQVFCDIMVYSKKIGVDYSEREMMI
ncbi:MAG: hypothetical protein K5895_08335 [Lachnospiraceae bacterium]|nr:hypothetical protein [Lachnospiraceae bacterium]